MKWLHIQYTILVLLFLSAILISSRRENNNEDILKVDRLLVLMRHAIAPGFGDPEYFELEDRTTQRNLSKEGIEQAKKAGQLLKSLGIEEAKVFSSQWFRCLDTAEQLNYGEVTELPFLNSFFNYPERKEEQTEAAKKWFEKSEFHVPYILVTHQVNITALLNIVPASGEMLILEHSKQGTLKLLHRITPE